jgi:NitT/TauT family transport system substrate-binding protein
MLAGTGGLLGWYPRPVAAEPPPETTTIRLVRYPFDITCVAPQWVAEELLRAEGFSTVEYVQTTDSALLLATGEVDMALLDAPGLVLLLDAAKPIVTLTGVHGGCYELFATDSVQSVRDLRGRTVAALSTAYQAFVAAMVSYVGLDPRKDITFVVEPEAMQLFIEGKVDAILGFPPVPQELRARKIALGGEHDAGSPLVPVFLLHGGGETGVRPQAPGRDQAGAPGTRQGDRRLRC